LASIPVASRAEPTLGESHSFGHDVAIEQQSDPILKEASKSIDINAEQRSAGDLNDRRRTYRIQDCRVSNGRTPRCLTGLGR
jgi:hypothetical protein